MSMIAVGAGDLMDRTALGGKKGHSRIPGSFSRIGSRMFSKHPDRIVVRKAVRGWVATHYCWNNDPETTITGWKGKTGFWEPYQTSIVAWKKRSGAVAEAERWSKAEGLEYGDIEETK